MAGAETHAREQDKSVGEAGEKKAPSWTFRTIRRERKRLAKHRSMSKTNVIERLTFSGTRISLSVYCVFINKQKRESSCAKIKSRRFKNESVNVTLFSSCRGKSLYIARRAG